MAYEHIYLTGVYETWMGVRGPQAGQADTEEYHAFKIADGVYLLYWNEGVLTAQMTFLFNFFAGNCVAELFARVEGDVVHSTIGADHHAHPHQAARTAGRRPGWTSTRATERGPLDPRRRVGRLPLARC